MMLTSEVLAGEHLAERVRALLESGAAFLHVHFAGPGCFAFRVDPADLGITLRDLNAARKLSRRGQSRLLAC